MAAPPVAGAITVQAMNPASPEPKRPRQRDQATAPAAVQDVTLPQVVLEVAALRSRFDRDEVFVEGIHSAVDANAIILAEVISRLEAVEAKATETEASVGRVRVDAEANDVRLDTQIRTELNAVTTRLGDELRAALLKVDESITKLEAVVQRRLLQRPRQESINSPSPTGVSMPLLRRSRRWSSSTRARI